MPDNPGVRIDIAHAKLIEGLVCAHKPARVLEFGFGGGRSTEAILRGLEFNQQPIDYTLVDNWRDWNGTEPEDAKTFLALHPQVALICLSEGDYVARCKQSFDFIMSDADHLSAHLWHDRVYADLLNPGGVLVYHDVRAFPGLGEIESKCVERGLRFVTFDRNSRQGEACQRGLLCIFKPQE